MRGKRALWWLVAAGVAVCAALPALGQGTARAANWSYTNDCAEISNVNIPFAGSVTAFVIEVSHPMYAFTDENCEPILANCPAEVSAPEGEPGIVKVFDDGETVVDAVTMPGWPREESMLFSVDERAQSKNVHYIRIYRRVLGEDTWPQFLVLYANGTLRLCPQPPPELKSVCFGSAVVIGPAAVSREPEAPLAAARYETETKTLKLVYRGGGLATLHIGLTGRFRAQVRVEVGYATGKAPFATFRSMHVEPGMADVDHVRWVDESGGSHLEDVRDFRGGAGREWFFYRAVPSVHNASAPDVRIGIL